MQLKVGQSVFLPVEWPCRLKSALQRLYGNHDWPVCDRFTVNSGEKMSQVDPRLLDLAIETAEKSKPGRPENPKVGAVIKLSNGEVHSAYRGEIVDGYTGRQSPGDHAEFTLLQKKLRSKARLDGSVLYTTLEPCTDRNHDKLPCVEWVIQKGIKQVIVGILDPNPRICGRGYWRLIDAGVKVDFFPSTYIDQMIQDNREFVDVHRAPVFVDEKFATLLRHYQSQRVAPYKLFGFGDAVELLASPDRRNGWALGEITLHRRMSDPFVLPKHLRRAYKDYFRDFNEVKGFADDGTKYMLEQNPAAWTEAPTLNLFVRPTKYSQQHFYRDTVSPNTAQAAALMDTLLRGPLMAEFPHACSLHMVVVTKDQYILITERSKKTGTYQALWSVSAEEDLHPSDFATGAGDAFLLWGHRLLQEELQLTPEAYRDEELRLLSVFLETDLLNISFCGFAEIRYTREQLDLRLTERRGDIEFVKWDFLKIERTELLTEIFGPAERHYHPSSRYRLLIVFLKCFGRPHDSELEAILARA
jgi:pyrimidine deaminase RibD-like protein